jgi:hypothetical protein
LAQRGKPAATLRLRPETLAHPVLLATIFLSSAGASSSASASSRQASNS